jgi:hypothetical protein
MRIFVLAIAAATSVFLSLFTEDQLLCELSAGISIFACLYLIREITYERSNKVN